MANSKRHSGPQLACEITADRVIAARATDDGVSLESFTSRSLPAGAVVPHLSEANLGNAAAVQQAVSDALSTVGARSKDLVAILPDAAVRVALLEFDTLPDKKADADGMIRFRLKKALPFDVERAAISYDIHRSDGKVRVVAAVMVANVLAEYESLFRDLGYAPGVVLPSSLASLANVQESDPVMVIKSDSNTTSMSIVGGGELLLFRILENTGGMAPGVDQLADDVHASMVFFEDTYQTRPGRVLLGGLLDADALGAELQDHVGTRVQPLVASSTIGSVRPNFPASALAGVTGALLG